MTSESMAAIGSLLNDELARLVIDPDAERKWAEIERERHEWEFEALLNRAGVPQAYRSAFLDPFSPDGARLIEWLDDPNDGVILSGGYGVGKTYLAVATMMEAMEEWVCSGRFVTATRYLMACIEGDTMAYFTPRILVLDDLGKEKPTEYAISQIFTLIDERLARGKKTIITTNYGKQELLERFTTADDTTTAIALASRFKRFLTMRVDGHDRR